MSQNFTISQGLGLKDLSNLMQFLSKIAMELEGQQMFQILAKAKELEKNGKEIIHFEIGDPDFNTPENIVNKCIESLKQGNTHYTTSAGLISFREAAADRTFKSRGFKPDIDQILVTQGANTQIYYSLACIADPGDEIITVDPCFVSYKSIMKLLGLRSIHIPLLEQNNFKLDIDYLKKLISKKTKAILFNSPHNPTGSVMNEEEIKTIYDIAEKNNIYLISDEVYARMVFKDSENKFYSPGQIDHCKERTIIIHSLSKSYAMTGWRIGGVTAPSRLINKMALLLETISSCVSPFIQEAAIEAITSSQKEINEMIDTFQERRDLIHKLVNNINGISAKLPDGAFYLFANIKETGMNDIEFANKILNDVGVATCPGSYFGQYGAGYVRFCFANSTNNIKKGISRINEIFK